MAKFTIRYHKTGAVEEFEFDGTRQQFIDKKFGNGGVNASYATVEEVGDKDVSQEETDVSENETAEVKKESFVQKVKKALKK